MLSIRLSRVGKKKAPIYRVVVMPKTRDPWAKTTEILGNYNPRTKVLTAPAERIQHWVKNGAECSDTVWNILIDNKVVEGKKRSITHISGKRKGDMEKAVAEKKAKEDAAKAKAEAAKAAEEAAKLRLQRLQKQKRKRQKKQQRQLQKPQHLLRKNQLQKQQQKLQRNNHSNTTAAWLWCFCFKKLISHHPKHSQ